MKLSVIMPVGPTNTLWLADAFHSAVDSGADEVIMVLHRDTPFAEEIIPTSPLKIIRDWTPGSRIGHAKNIGIAAATGDWICILDSDDRMIKAGQAAVRHLAGGGEFDIIYGRVVEFGEGIEARQWPITSIPSLLPASNQVPVSAWFRKDVWWRIHGYRNVMYEDWDFWIRAWDEDDARFRMVPEVFYHHRRWPGSEGAKIGYRSDLGFKEI